MFRLGDAVAGEALGRRPGRFARHRRGPGQIPPTGPGRCAAAEAAATIRYTQAAVACTDSMPSVKSGQA
ncbi:hypothetical protein OG625_01275 [Streptomyces sp. NBC_01351]|uniref:hypothetical protein n=1 Tax=Streptomyces sp. NBC_01351 TaxID=2903833 RepID=UPI002E32F043|nr:hypothetical protein [Streptomyces sp. NBC_01351]